LFVPAFPIVFFFLALAHGVVVHFRPADLRVTPAAVARKPLPDFSFSLCANTVTAGWLPLVHLWIYRQWVTCARGSALHQLCFPSPPCLNFFLQLPGQSLSFPLDFYARGKCAQCSAQFSSIVSLAAEHFLAGHHAQECMP
jgi:hypothetical protein